MIYRQSHVQLFSVRSVYLAPLRLCSLKNFDLRDDKEFCPPERNDLKEFYDVAKGSDWTNSTNWLDDYESHCHWFGVLCDDSSHTFGLDLRNNGLSGKLTSSIGNFSHLEELDLSDNDIRVRRPRRCFCTHFRYL